MLNPFQQIQSSFCHLKYDYRICHWQKIFGQTINLTSIWIIKNLLQSAWFSAKIFCDTSKAQIFSAKLVRRFGYFLRLWPHHSPMLISIWSYVKYFHTKVNTFQYSTHSICFWSRQITCATRGGGQIEAGHCFHLLFSFFYAFCFSSTSENLPCVKICFPQYFGITRRNI